MGAGSCREGGEVTSNEVVTDERNKNLYIKPALHKRVRRLALELDKTLLDTVDELLTSALDAKEKELGGAQE